jgi:hypothetical protein
MTPPWELGILLRHEKDGDVIRSENKYNISELTELNQNTIAKLDATPQETVANNSFGNHDIIAAFIAVLKQFDVLLLVVEAARFATSVDRAKIPMILFVLYFSLELVPSLWFTLKRPSNKWVNTRLWAKSCSGMVFQFVVLLLVIKAARYATSVDRSKVPI